MNKRIYTSIEKLSANVEEQLPVGYRIVDLREPRVGEIYWGFTTKKVERASFGFCGTLAFILEKIHQPPEIIKVLFRGEFHDVSGDHAWKPTKRMSFHSSYDDTRNVTGNYDAMIAVNLDGSETIALGHWNDGIQGNE